MRYESARCEWLGEGGSADAGHLTRVGVEEELSRR